MTNGDGVPVIQPQPSPFSFAVDRLDQQVAVENGDRVAVVRLAFWDPTGTKVFFMPAPIAAQMADGLRSAAAGLAIVHEIGDQL